MVAESSAWMTAAYAVSASFLYMVIACFVRRHRARHQASDDAVLSGDPPLRMERR
jgi:hypothetical protein